MNPQPIASHSPSQNTQSTKPHHQPSNQPPFKQPFHSILSCYSLLLFSSAIVSIPQLATAFTPTHTPPASSQNIPLIASAQGRGTLTIINGTRDNAAAKLVDSRSGETRHFVRIPPNDQITIRGISPCSCILKATTGTNWDSRTGRFLTNSRFFQFDDQLEFRETSTAASAYRATLHAVANGNARTTSISERDF